MMKFSGRGVAWICALFLSLANSAAAMDEDRFMSLYRDACNHAAAAEGLTPRKAGKIRFDSPAYGELRRQGPSCLARIAGVCTLARRPDGTYSDYGVSTNLWVEVTLQNDNPQFNPLAHTDPQLRFDGGRELAKAWTKSLLKGMRRNAESGNIHDAAVLRAAIAAQGIFALPTLFEELEAGAPDLLPVFERIRWPPEDTPEITPQSLQDWWHRNEEKYRLPTIVPDFLQRHPGCSILWVDSLSVLRFC